MILLLIFNMSANIDSIVSACALAIEKAKAISLDSGEIIKSDVHDSQKLRQLDAIQELDVKRKHVEKEAIKCLKDNDLLRLKWNSVSELAGYQEIQNEIDKQLQLCSSVTKSKDDMISTLTSARQTKNREYVTVIRSNNDDLYRVASTVEKESENSRRKFEEESKKIHNSLINTRESLTSTHSATFSTTMDHKRSLEMESLLEKKNRESQHDFDFDSIALNDANKTSLLKSELESESQELVRSLESLKASLLFDATKLTYDHRALKQQDEEKMIDAEKSKRQITKLKGSLNSLVATHQSIEKQHNRQCKELTEDYRSLTQKYKSLQLKFKHFEVADTNIYRQVWNMHKDESVELTDQLIQIDKIVSENLLGNEWYAPNRTFLRSQSDDLQSRSLSTTQVASEATITTDDRTRKSQNKLASDLDSYWRSIENLVDDERVQLWNQLLQDYSNYRVVLERRKSDLREIENLKSQNALLTRQLQHKLRDSVHNDAFKVSPVLALKVKNQDLRISVRDSVSTYAASLAEALPSCNQRTLKSRSQSIHEHK